MGTDARCRVAADDPWYVVGIDDEDVGQRRRVDGRHGSALPVAGEQLGGDVNMRNACASGVFRTGRRADRFGTEILGLGQCD